MKVAVLILVLANFAVFAWLHWIRIPPPSVPLTPVTGSAMELTLLPAGGSGPAAGGVASGAPPSTAFETVATCLLFGPVASATAAERLAARLNTGGYRVRAFARMVQVPGNYRVVLGGFRDAEEAGKTAAALRAGGIEDLFIRSLADGEAPSLSLGVFRERDHARRRAAQVRALGLEPEIKVMMQRRARRYLEMRLPAGASATAALHAMGVTGAPRRRACVPASAAPPATAMPS